MVSALEQHVTNKLASVSSTALNCCLSNMRELRQLHARILTMGLFQLEVFLRKIITFCAVTDPCSIEYGRKVLAQIDCPSTYIWNTMIRGYASSPQPLKGIDVYNQMLRRGASPDAYTYPFLLKACSNSLSVRKSREIHCRAVKTGFDSNLYVKNSLLHAYGVAGEIRDAHRLFDEISEPDVASSTTLLSVYVNSLDVGKARKLFDEMPERNVVTWSAMIAGYVQASCYEEAVGLFREMQVKGIEPNDATLVSLISACAHLGSLEQGRWIHSYMQNNNRTLDTRLNTALIDMYCKCGSTERAILVFKLARDRDVTVWTSLISGLASHGFGTTAAELFEEMQRSRVAPNDLTLVAVLSACTHAGLVQKGLSIFKRMRSEFCIEPKIQHYGCIVDLLGRAGLVMEALDLIESMPMKPNVAVWGALFSACRIHGHAKLGEQVASKLLTDEPQNGALYMALMNMYNETGRVDEAEKVKIRMKENSCKKNPGCSVIEVNGTCTEFIVGDLSHPQALRVCSNLGRLVQEIYRGTLLV
ncbi:unnamed protein product [Victoria cruziana]